MFITSSLSKEQLASIYLKNSSYSVGGLIIEPQLFKILMDGAELDTMVTSAKIRQELQEDVKILKQNSNVTEFLETVNASI